MREVTTWCSNRSRKVESLQEEYRALVDARLEPHEKVVKEAHETYREQRASPTENAAGEE